MKKSTTFILCLFLLILSCLDTFGEKAVYRFYYPPGSKPHKSLFKNRDIASAKTGEYIDLVLEEEELKELRDLPGYRIEKLFTESDLKARLDPEYHTYTEVQAILGNYETTNSTLCKLYDIADTWEKTVGGSIYKPNYDSREIWMLNLSDNVTIDEEEPEILIMGAHHAREPISTEVVLYILEQLVRMLY